MYARVLVGRSASQRPGEINHGSRRKNRKNGRSQEGDGYQQEHGLPQVRQGHAHRKARERPGARHPRRDLYFVFRVRVFREVVSEGPRSKGRRGREQLLCSGLHILHWKSGRYTATVTDVSVLVTGRYSVSRSIGSRPAARISLSSSSRRMPCGVVAPASW
jgi:hypothetical protein